MIEDYRRTRFAGRQRAPRIASTLELRGVDELGRLSLKRAKPIKAARRLVSRATIGAASVQKRTVRGMVRVPVSMARAGSLAGYDELGFSLKPPKAIRKVATAIKKATTIKNVLKVGAVVAGAALIPGALPLLAKGVVGGAKLAVGGAKLLGRGAVAAEKALVGGVKGAAGILTGRMTNKNGPAGPTVADAIPDLITSQGEAVALPATAAVAPSSIMASPEPAPAAMTYSTGGGGGASFGPSPTTDPGATDQPQQAGIGGAMPMLALAGVALLVLTSRSPRRR